MNCDQSSGDSLQISCEIINQKIDGLVSNYEEKIIKHITSEYIKNTSWSDRLADKIAKFGGSWKFITIFAIFLTLWIVWNTLFFTKHFDESPYILLNLVLSFVAAFQAPIILMSQNRHAEQDKHEAIIDFAINYKAEQEIDDIQSHLHRFEDDIHEIKRVLSNIEKAMHL